LRYRIFKDNLKFIEQTNAKNLSFKLGIGPFTDLTNEEFREKHLMKTRDLLKIMSNESYSEDKYQAQGQMDFKLGQTKINWMNSFRAPLRQGACASSWAFSTVASLEGNYQKNFGDYLRFSHQQLIDCDTSNYGRRAGWVSESLKYVKEKGIAFEDWYSYMNEGNPVARECRYKYITPNYILDSFEECPFGSCNRSKILSMLSQGPLSAVMDGEGNGYFKDYKSGVLDMPCTSINHAINIIGVDSDEIDGYYIGRNSWGTNWGENGYFRMRFNDSTQSCFMDSAAFRPNVKRSSNSDPCILLYPQCDLKGDPYNMFHPIKFP
jgi:Papain family cysteine protease/Cathepsin propeptide inhibitor domain (I29)